MVAISRERFAGFLVIEDDFIATTPCLLGEMRAAGKAHPHPLANHRAGELYVSLATVPGLDAKPIKAGALFGSALRACVIANVPVCAKRFLIRCLSAACGKIVRR